MHPEILSEGQRSLLTFIKLFNRSFYLVGGTAIALHMGHRRSIDFDLFTSGRLNKRNIYSHLDGLKISKTKIGEDADQLHYLLGNVKITFFSFPYPVPQEYRFQAIVKLPSLLSLAAMKAFALGRRAKWKDYVDLYFIIRDHYTLSQVAEQANNIFNFAFSPKLFYEQLSFHKDIDYSEKIEYLVPAPPDEDIKAFLIEKAIDIF